MEFSITRKADFWFQESIFAVSSESELQTIANATKNQYFKVVAKAKANKYLLLINPLQ